MACSTTFGTEGGVGDAARLRVLPRTEDSVDTKRHMRVWGKVSNLT